MDDQKKSDKKKKFVEAYDAHSEAIYRHCFFRVYSKARAEELAQETFMRVWEYLGKSNEPIGNIRALLYRIATNLIIDDSRKRKETSLETLLEVSEANEPAYAGHKDMERQVLWKGLVREMDKLDEDERQVLVMRYIDDLDPKEISGILKISPNNVSVKINRAIAKLKTKIYP